MHVVVDHGHHGVLHAPLVLAEAVVHVLAELLAERVDDELAVGDLLPVELDEGQEPAFGAQLVLVLDVLQGIEGGSELATDEQNVDVQGHRTGCRTGYGDKLSSTQAEPGQAIKSAVAYFPSISCATSCRVALYI